MPKRHLKINFEQQNSWFFSPYSCFSLICTVSIDRIPLFQQFRPKVFKSSLLPPRLSHPGFDLLTNHIGFYSKYFENLTIFHQYQPLVQAKIGFCLDIEVICNYPSCLPYYCLFPTITLRLLLFSSTFPRSFHLTQNKFQIIIAYSCLHVLAPFPFSVPISYHPTIPCPRALLCCFLAIFWMCQVLFYSRDFGIAVSSTWRIIYN